MLAHDLGWITSGQGATRERLGTMAESLGTIWVCVDCVLTHANGETEGTPDHEPLALLDDYDVALGMAWAEHDDGCEREDGGECECETIPFTWSQCEGCGSSLGGSRHALTLLERG